MKFLQDLGATAMENLAPYLPKVRRNLELFLFQLSLSSLSTGLLTTDAAFCQFGS